MKKRLLLSVVLALISPLSLFTTADAAHLPFGKPTKGVCSRQKDGVANCSAHIVYEDGSKKPLATASFANGYKPADLASAYKLPALPTGAFASNGQTVAIVDAYNNPNTASDVLAYRKQFNLPICSTANPTPSVADQTSCFFTKLNQKGAALPLPASNTSWGQEIDLDLDMVSASCPSCKILLVESNSSSFADLGSAVNAAAAAGANAISNSYGGSESSSETAAAMAAPYNHPGIAVTVSTGDSGYGVEFPASSPYVTAVGGTSLTAASNTRGWTEAAWNGAGSGCSTYVAKLTWQKQIGTCSKRMVADVSAVANPNTGVAVYDSYGSTGGANWLVFGGTSVASPIVAGVYALAGNAGATSKSLKYGEYPYAHLGGLYDVSSGSNGNCTSFFSRSNLALCTSAAGYDGPTGLGSPNGTSAF
ncbi:MAG: peptidase [Candidatus Saccharibacteria bacterium]|nr:peptidase [Candidatus Saccharibacteria bacterium]